MNAVAIIRTSREHYNQTIDTLSTHALELFLEIVSKGEVGPATADASITEAIYELLVGFGSPLDAMDGAETEDQIALAMLSLSPNRHAVATSPTVKRLTAGDPAGTARLFIGDDCIDFRFLAAVALHQDVMVAYRTKFEERLTRGRREPMY